MGKRLLIALLSMIMLFGVVPAYGAGTSGNSLIWEGYNDNGRMVGINFTTFTGRKSTTKSIYNKQASQQKIIGNWIYFLVEDEEDHYSIAKIKTDGSAFAYVSQDDNFASFDVAGDTIYFVKSEYNGNLYDDLSYGSMKTDGTKKQIILPVSPFYNFEINKEYVYYTERHTDLFYRMKKDGTATKSLSSKGVSVYKFYGNVLFFSEMIDGGYSSRGVFAELDGTRKKTFASDGYIHPLAYLNNKFYYRKNTIDKVGNTKSIIYVYNRYTGKKNKFAYIDYYDRFLGQVGNGLAFLTFPKGDVYKIGLDGK